MKGKAGKVRVGMEWGRCERRSEKYLTETVSGVLVAISLN